MVDYSQIVEFSNLNSWYNPNWGGGYQVRINLTLTEDLVDGGSVNGWSFTANLLDSNGSYTGGYSSPSSDFNSSTGVFDNTEQGYQPEFEVGDVISFNVQVDGIAFEESDYSFSFTDLDTLANTETGTAGDDTVSGNENDNLLYGLGGNDTLNGNGGSDYLDGGAGNDSLNGGNGEDTYFFEIGDGMDTITDNNTNEIDTIEFGASIGLADLSFEESGDNLVINYANGDSITINNYLQWEGNRRIERVRFSNGDVQSLDSIVSFDNGSWTDDVYNLTGAVDIISTGTGNDYVNGGGGNDQINGGDDNDELHGWQGDDIIHGGNGADYLFGGHGNDEVYGDAGDDVILQHGGQNDILDGGEGFDRLTYELYENPLGIEIDLNLSENQVSKFDGRFFDNVSGFETYTGSAFDDVMTAADDAVIFNGYDGNDVLNGGAGDDQLSGGAGNDTIYGGGGVDRMVGGAGDDKIYGEGGSDFFVGGTGNDSFDGGAGLNTVNYSRLTSSITADLGAESDHVIKAGGEIDQIANYFQFIGTNYDDNLTADRNTVVFGGDGDDTITGAGGAEYLKGDSGNDILNGKGYRDRLFGGAGDDTFIFERGGGDDTIVNDDTVSTNDVMSFASGIDHDQLWFEQSGQDLVVSVIGTSDTVTMDDWYGGNFTVDNITSGDGYTLTSSDVANLVSAMSSLTTPSAGQTELSDAGLDDDLAAVLAANWTA